MKNLFDSTQYSIGIVKGTGNSFGHSFSPITFNPIKGLFIIDPKLEQDILRNCKRKSFEGLKDFLDNCYSDEWEYVCLFPDRPLGRLGYENHRLLEFNYNCHLADWNRIEIRKIKAGEEFGGIFYAEDGYKIITSIDWVGSFEASESFILKHRKFKTVGEYKKRIK